MYFIFIVVVHRFFFVRRIQLYRYHVSYHQLFDNQKERKKLTAFAYTPTFSNCCIKENVFIWTMENYSGWQSVARRWTSVACTGVSWLLPCWLQLAASFALKCFSACTSECRLCRRPVNNCQWWSGTCYYFLIYFLLFVHSIQLTWLKYIDRTSPVAKNNFYRFSSWSSIH